MSSLDFRMPTNLEASFFAKLNPISSKSNSALQIIYSNSDTILLYQFSLITTGMFIHYGSMGDEQCAMMHRMKQ